MQLLQTNQFRKTYKKLKANQRPEVDDAIRDIISDPSLGEMKKGDLRGVQVYKFRMARELALLAYDHDESNKTIMLLALGSHENFYRDLKGK